MQDANKNSLYVHEVFIAENIKKGDTLQTAASKPHGGISLYRDILANVLSVDKHTKSVPENQAEGQEVAENVVVDDNVSPEDRTQPSVDAEIEQAKQATNLSGRMP